VYWELIFYEEFAPLIAPFQTGEQNSGLVDRAISAADEELSVGDGRRLVSIFNQKKLQKASLCTAPRHHYSACDLRVSESTSEREVSARVAINGQSLRAVGSIDGELSEEVESELKAVN
jgi:hypothetical protein